MNETFEAFRIHQDAQPFKAGIETMSVDDLTAGEVVVEVAYSGINYKDAMAGSGKVPILRISPLNGGIDLAGTVVESTAADYKVGDSVLAQGGGLSERYDGGYARYARLPAECLVPIPPGLDAYSAMVIGTAGFTAAMAIEQMETNHQSPEMGAVLVTGASGGVGSFAIQLLAKLGYHAVAATRKSSAHDYLRKLGAAEIIPALEPIDGALGKQLWAGAIDNLGGQALATILKATKMIGNVVCVGRAASDELSTSVLPFIIRGVNLLGATSANCKPEIRRRIWQRLASDMKPDHIDDVVNTVIGLKQLPEYFEKSIAGQIQGRVVVDLGA